MRISSAFHIASRSGKKSLKAWLSYSIAAQRRAKMLKSAMSRSTYSGLRQHKDEIALALVISTHTGASNGITGSSPRSRPPHQAFRSRDRDFRLARREVVAR